MKVDMHKKKIHKFELEENSNKGKIQRLKQEANIYITRVKDQKGKYKILEYKYNIDGQINNIILDTNKKLLKKRQFSLVGSKI